MKLTIITINYNNAAGLEKTMKSVLSQDYTDFEYLVVDGTTSPPTPLPGERGEDREVLESFVESKQTSVNGFTVCSWKSLNGTITGGYYSEPDSGIYNAMNKGIRMAKGEYVHFLNSGDWLVYTTVVRNIHQEFEKNDVSSTAIWDILVGNVISVRPDGKKRRGYNDPNVSLFTFYWGTIQHSSAYIRRNLFERYGLYDESLKIVSDWKWYLQVVGLNAVPVAFTDIDVSYFDTTGISSTQLDLDKKERRQVLEELLPKNVLKDYDQFFMGIIQMQRIKKHRMLYFFVNVIERIVFKLEKIKLSKLSWIQ